MFVSGKVSILCPFGETTHKHHVPYADPHTPKLQTPKTSNTRLDESPGARMLRTRPRRSCSSEAARVHGSLESGLASSCFRSLGFV